MYGFEPHFRFDDVTSSFPFRRHAFPPRNDFRTRSMTSSFRRESSQLPRDNRGVQISSGIQFPKPSRDRISEFYFTRLCLQLSSVIYLSYEASSPDGRSYSSYNSRQLHHMTSVALGTPHHSSEDALGKVPLSGNDMVVSVPVT